MTKRKKNEKKLLPLRSFGPAKIEMCSPITPMSVSNVFLATRSLSHQCQENISCHLCSTTIIPDWHLTTCYTNRTLPTLLWCRRMAFFFADSRQSSTEILRKCFSVPWLSDFLPFHLLLFCKCHGTLHKKLLISRRSTSFGGFSPNAIPVSYTHLTLPTTPYV